MSSSFTNFIHFFTKKNNEKKDSNNDSEVKVTEFNEQKFYRSKSGRYKALNKKRNKLTDDTFAPIQTTSSSPSSYTTNTNSTGDLGITSASNEEKKKVSD